MAIDNEQLIQRYGTPEQLEKRINDKIKKVNNVIEQKGEFKTTPAVPLSELAKQNLYRIIPQQFSPLEMSLNEAKELFNLIVYNTGLNIKYTDKELQIVENLLLYFLNNKESIYDLSKGLYLVGFYGSGKSRLMYILRSFCKLIDKNNFEVVNYKKLNDDIKIKGLKVAEKLPNYGNLLIDDLGFLGESKINSYGNSFDLLMTIVNDRYEKWFVRKIRTYYTSNIQIDSEKTPEQTIKHIYGEGISGRLKDSCNVILFNFQQHR